jgi:ribonuclease M5
MIKEIIVVEGRDDEAAVKRAVDAETIATHGFGIRAETLARIAKAYQNGNHYIYRPGFCRRTNKKKTIRTLSSGSMLFYPG